MGGMGPREGGGEIGPWPGSSSEICARQARGLEVLYPRRQVDSDVALAHLTVVLGTLEGRRGVLRRDAELEGREATEEARGAVEVSRAPWTAATAATHASRRAPASSLSSCRFSRENRLGENSGSSATAMRGAPTSTRSGRSSVGGGIIT